MNRGIRGAAAATQPVRLRHRQESALNEKFGATEPAYAPRSDLDGPTLIDLATRLLEMSGKAFLREFADSPLSRARRNGLLRNVCVALGNWGAPEAGPVLERAAHDHSALVREHAEWALARIQAG